MEEKQEERFEDKILKAQTHLEALTKPEITLSESVEVYKEGLKQIEAAQKLLDEAKLEFETLSKR